MVAAPSDKESEVKVTLTAAQKRVLRKLCDEHSDGAPFTSLEAFPERNNVHNARRRTLRSLAKKGIIETMPDGAFVVGEKALELLATIKIRR